MMHPYSAHLPTCLPARLINSPPCPHTYPPNKLTCAHLPTTLYLPHLFHPSTHCSTHLPFISSSLPPIHLCLLLAFQIIFTHIDNPATHLTHLPLQHLIKSPIYPPYELTPCNSTHTTTNILKPPTIHLFSTYYPTCFVCLFIYVQADSHFCRTR